MDVTLFGFDLSDAGFETPFPDASASTSGGGEDGSEGADSDRRALVAVGVLVGFALLARYLDRSQREPSDGGANR